MKNGQKKEISVNSGIQELSEAIKATSDAIIQKNSDENELRKALLTSEIRYRRLFETAQDGILILDYKTGKIIDANPFILKMIDYTKKQLAEKTLWEIGAFHDIAKSKEAFKELQLKKYIRYEDKPLQKQDGNFVYVEFISNVYLVDHIKVIQCNIRDITDRKLAEKKLQDRLNFEKAVGKITIHLSQLKSGDNLRGISTALKYIAKSLGFDSAYIFLFSADRKMITTLCKWCKYKWCKKFTTIQAQEIAVGLYDAIARNDVIAIPDVSALKTNWRLKKKIWMQKKIKSLFCFPLISSGQRIGFIELNAIDSKKDINSQDVLLLTVVNKSIVGFLERNLLEKKLTHLASFDFLTDLPNRMLFEKTINKEISRATRHHHMVALFSMDIDKFKNINDTYGHDFGDLLLQHVANRIQKNIRKEDFVARMGGDEFALILSEINTISDVEKIAQKIMYSIQKPFKIGGHVIRITSSIGISIFPRDAKKRITLFKKADIALYSAKQAGRNNYRFSLKKLKDEPSQVITQS